MASTEDEKRWLEELAKAGRDNVRVRLMDPKTSGLDRGADVMHIIEHAPHPSRGFVDDWLAEEDERIERRGTRRFRIIAGLASISAIAAIVAAVRGCESP